MSEVTERKLCRLAKEANASAGATRHALAAQILEDALSGLPDEQSD